MRLERPRSPGSFRGYGPIPGIIGARLAEGALGIGGRIRVENSDGSVHHERIVAFERERLVALEMELERPVSAVLAGIHERVEIEPIAGGTRVTRRFEVIPRSTLTWPLAWVVARFLRRAVVAHNTVMTAALSPYAGSR